MSTSYIPVRDSLLLVWSQNFADTLAANPANYGLTDGDATAVTAANDAYAGAYAVATTAATRTKPSVAAKDTARGQLLVLLRSYSQIIQKNLGVSQELKTALGLPIHDAHPTPVPAPTSAPTLGFLATTFETLKLTYHDPDQSELVKAKPSGVLQMQLVAVSSSTVITDPTSLPAHSVQTKTPFNASFPGDSGKKIYFAARWVTRRGLVGPWSAVGSAVCA